jgi:hypothetical protein
MTKNDEINITAAIKKRAAAFAILSANTRSGFGVLSFP